MDDRTTLQREIAAHERRLAVLREQAALKGYSTDPATTLEIADIEQTIAKLRDQLGQPAAEATTAPPVFVPQPTGDVITATISGSRNVAVGKNIAQHIGEASTDGGSAELSAGLVALEQAVAAAPITPASAMLATFQLQLLRGELLKPLEDGQPSANVIMQVGDWLIENVPTAKSALAALLGSPTCQRIVTQPVREWAQRRF